MKYIRIIAITIFFHIVMNIFMPWWNIFIAGMIAGYFSKLKALQTFLIVFLSLSIYWFILLFKIDAGNDHILSGKLAEMFSVEPYLLFIIMNSLLGGLFGSFGSQIGWRLRKIIKKETPHEIHNDTMDTKDYLQTQPERRDDDLL